MGFCLEEVLLLGHKDIMTKAVSSCLCAEESPGTAYLATGSSASFHRQSFCSNALCFENTFISIVRAESFTSFQSMALNS